MSALLPLLLVLVLLLLFAVIIMDLVLDSVLLKTVALAFHLRVHTPEKHFWALVLSTNMIHNSLMFLQISNNFLETHEILPVYVNNYGRLLLEEDHFRGPEKETTNITETTPLHSSGLQGLNLFMVWVNSKTGHNMTCLVMSPVTYMTLV